MTFFEWLMNQTERDDIVGDLARDTKRKAKEPDNLVPVKSNSKKVWAEYLSVFGYHVVEAFEDAWGEYVCEGQSAQV